jgi:hypothetical protein
MRHYHPDFQDPIPWQRELDPPAMSKDEQIEVMSQALNNINRIIFGHGAPLGSTEYFAIRMEAVDSLAVCGIKVE